MCKNFNFKACFYIYVSDGAARSRRSEGHGIVPIYRHHEEQCRMVVVKGPALGLHQRHHDLAKETAFPVSERGTLLVGQR